jgi:YqaJ-like viral recombinase domain
VTARLLMTADETRADRRGWLEARRHTEDGGWRVTASEIAQVCGIAPRSHGGPYKLYWNKIMGRETGETDEMRRGRALEPVVLGEFADSHPGLVLLPGGLYCMDEAPHLAATLDAEAIEADTAAALGIPGDAWHLPGTHDHAALPADGEVMVVEAKTSIPMDDWGEEDTGQVPDHILAQVLFQAHVRGAQRVFVAVKPITTWRPVRTYTFEIGPKEKAQIDWMVEQAEAFIGHLDRGEPPPVDWYPATTAILWERHPGPDIDPDAGVLIPVRLASRYRALAYAKDVLDRRIGQVQNEILARAGNAGQIWTRDGGRQVKVATRTCSDVREHTVPAHTQNRLNRAGWARRSKKHEGEGS